MFINDHKDLQRINACIINMQNSLLICGRISFTWNMNIFCVFLVFLQGFVVGLLCLNFRTGRHGTRQATFERFDNTCGDRNVLIIFSYDGMKSEGAKLIMNSTITAKQDVNLDMTTTITIKRCKNRENLDTCEHFYDHKVEDYCKMVESENALWSPLFGNFVPKYKCPVKKGLYRATNSEFDISALLLFPLDAWYWRVRVEVRDKATESLVTCMIVEARVATLSKK